MENFSHYSLVEGQSPPSTYAIAAFLEGEKGSAFRMLSVTLERSMFIGLGLALAGIKQPLRTKAALICSASVTGWILADYILKRERLKRNIEKSS